jgi:hypothetical protein
MRIRRSLLLVVGLAFWGAALPAWASAGVPVPALKTFAVAHPTNFVPGSEAGPGSPLGSNGQLPQYLISVANVGPTATTEPFTVVDSLPSGVEASTAAPPAWYVNPTSPSEPEPNGPCAVSGQVVTCTITASVPPGFTSGVHIPVNVSSNPPSSVLENHFSISGGGADPTSGSVSSTVSAAPAPFGILQDPGLLSGGAVSETGAPASTAGSHPYTVVLSAGFPTRIAVGEEEAIAAGSLRRLRFTLPTGLVVDPHATPVRCTEAQLTATETNPERQCPPESEVGEVQASLPNFLGGELIGSGLYNMVPPPGAPAELGFNLKGTNVHVIGGVDGRFHLTSDSSEILGKIAVGGLIAELWGNPSDPRHDGRRRGAGCGEGCSALPAEAAFLTMPSACSSSLSFSGYATSWEGQSSNESGPFGGPNGEMTAVQDCGSLQFAPTTSIRPTARGTDEPSGLSVHIHLPQNEGVSGRATATLKKVSVRLPEGMTVNPSAANGLGACSSGDVDLESAEPANCPNSSKVGTAEVETPVLETPLRGSIYLATQDTNPFGTLLAVYLVVEGEGVVIKLAGRVDADPITGRLTATFDNNPQLPFSDLQVDFTSGPRATLVTPSSCGSYNARTELTSWASETPVVVNSPITINQGCSGGGFSPKLEAGTTSPVAGSFSPFVLRVSRQDGEQNVSRVSVTLPQGLLAKLAGVGLCPEGQAAAGSCPASSQVGTTTTGVGAGGQPLYIPQPGKASTAVYLAGAYHGAPYSLVVKVPAQAGPFDLGTIAVRVALNVNPFTAQVTASSDPLPQILEGIPVSYRDIRVEATKPQFIVNPTSCEPMQVTSTIAAINGATANPSSHFQVGSCTNLGFKPSLKISLKGSTKRTGHPALKAVLTYPPKGSFANIARAQVNLPAGEFLDQGNLNKTCTRPVLLESKCPNKSIYGRARAWTPLLERPIEGPVYLVGGFGYKLPALVAELNGQIRVLLVGKVDTGKNKGIRNTFEGVPDAQVSRFVLEMKGGKKYGLFENSENLCKKPQRALIRLTGQNGAGLQAKPEVSRDCGRRSHS